MQSVLWSVEDLQTYQLNNSCHNRNKFRNGQIRFHIIRAYIKTFHTNIRSLSDRQTSKKKTLKYDLSFFSVKYDNGTFWQTMFMKSHNSQWIFSLYPEMGNLHHSSHTTHSSHAAHSCWYWRFFFWNFCYYGLCCG